MQIQRQKLIDGSAMGLSLLCLFHCLAMPLVVSVLPMLGAHLFEATATHVFFFAAALPLSFLGLWLGVRGAHGGRRLMIIAGAGFLLLFRGALHLAPPRDLHANNCRAVDSARSFPPH